MGQRRKQQRMVNLIDEWNQGPGEFQLTNGQAILSLAYFLIAHHVKPPKRYDKVPRKYTFEVIRVSEGR